MAVAGKIINNCFLPKGAKLGATVGMGAEALIGYKMVENNLSTNRSENNISVNADKVSGKA